MRYSKLTRSIVFAVERSVWPGALIAERLPAIYRSGKKSDRDLALRDPGWKIVCIKYNIISDINVIWDVLPSNKDENVRLVMFHVISAGFWSVLPLILKIFKNLPRFNAPEKFYAAIYRSG